MTQPRTFIIGDIHGHTEALLQCLNMVNFDFDTDHLISMGDLCDRGEDSYGVAETLMKIKNLIHIRGNHDQYLISFLSGICDRDSYCNNKISKPTADSYCDATDDDKIRHLNFYNQSIPYYVKDNICFVHGGFDRWDLISNQEENNLMWDRDLANQMMSCSPTQKLKTIDDFSHIFIGHTPTLYWKTPIPITRGGVTNIDTGCGKGGKLTIMSLETREYWQSDNF